MNKTKIDWCDSTFNPVTGCLHGCDYCYARKIANRFGNKYLPYGDGINEINFPVDGIKGIDPYPFGFEPTLHRYRLNEPAHKTKPRNIFVCSMADLFGEWVPTNWIEDVFKACEAAPQHRYLFLTKNPKRLCELANSEKLPARDNWWYGTSVTKVADKHFPGRLTYHTFLSIEPLLEPLNTGIGSFGGTKWIIIGAETGNRKDKVIPEKSWVENIVETASITHAAVFMKSSLRELMGDDFIQQYPWEDKK
jgi:protein gp37